MVYSKTYTNAFHIPFTMSQNKKIYKKKIYCVICLIEPVVSLLIIFLPMVKVRKQGFTSCRIELSSKYHRWLGQTALFIKTLIFFWNTYHLPEFCSQNEKLRCLTEISDCIFLFIGVTTLFPITKLYLRMIKAINLLTDIFESTKHHGLNWPLKENLGTKAYIISHSVKFGLYTFCLMNLIFCYFTLKTQKQNYIFVTVDKYFSLTSQVCVFVLYIYVTLLTKRIFKIVNNIFYFEMKNIFETTSRGNNLTICINEYKKQVFALKKMWINFSEAISSIAVISLVCFSGMCIIYSYCLIAWMNHDYKDIDWIYRTTILIVIVGMVFFCMDFESWVSRIRNQKYIIYLLNYFFRCY